MKVEYNKTYEEIQSQIKKCEGKHIQQVAYSTYHKTLTHICFGCQRVITQLKKETSK